MQVLEQEQMAAKAREARLQARSEQLKIELQLVEAGHLVEAELAQVRVSVDRPGGGESSLEGVLSVQVRRSQLPPTEPSLQNVAGAPTRYLGQPKSCPKWGAQQRGSQKSAPKWGTFQQQPKKLPQKAIEINH